MALFSSLPAEVSVYEVSPRDGLQNEAVTVATTRKVRLIEALIDAGLRRIEISSFVSPKWVPQLADAEEVVRLVPKHEGVTLSALCPNVRGLERAKAAKVEEIGVFISASETHNLKNVNKTVADTLAVFADVVGPAVNAGIRVRGYVSTLWGCPYEGHVDPKKGFEIAEKLLGLGCYQVSLGDTIGVGTPVQTRDILSLFLSKLPPSRSRCICTTPAGRPSPTCWWGSRWASAPSTPRWVASAAAPTRLARRATSPPRISSTPCTGWASPRGSTSRSSGWLGRSQRRWSDASSRARCTRPACNLCAVESRGGFRASLC